MNIIITTKSPLAHSGYEEGIDMGNISTVRRMRMIGADNKIVNVPVISGNAVRGKIRRILTQDFFDRFAIKEAFAEEKPATYDRFYSTLANGGTLSSNLDKSIDPQHIQEIRQKLPILSLLGGAAYHYIMSGMVQVGFAVLRCLEMGTSDKYANDYITEIGQVKHVDGTKENKEFTENKPMPYTTEAIIPGTSFDLTVNFLPQATELEMSCFMYGLKRLNSLGGKSASGYGEISLAYEEETSCKLYEEWLYDMKSHKEDFLAWIKEYAREL